jgi:preprotein translocase subunit SecG
MYSCLIFVLTFILVCTGVFIILVTLMQRPSSNAGLGSALGGGAIESAFGGETTRVLTRWTIYGIALFFIAATLLSMVYVARKNHGTNCGGLPTFEEVVKK